MYNLEIFYNTESYLAVSNISYYELWLRLSTHLWWKWKLTSCLVLGNRWNIPVLNYEVTECYTTRLKIYLNKIRILRLGSMTAKECLSENTDGKWKFP